MYLKVPLHTIASYDTPEYAMIDSTVLWGYSDTQFLASGLPRCCFCWGLEGAGLGGLPGPYAQEPQTFKQKSRTPMHSEMFTVLGHLLRAVGHMSIMSPPPPPIPKAMTVLDTCASSAAPPPPTTQKPESNESSRHLSCNPD